MSNKILLSLAMVGLFAATAKAENASYAAETRVDWIKEGVSAYTGISSGNGTWAGATEQASIVSNKIALDTDQDNPLTFDPTAGLPTGGVVSYRVDAVMVPTLYASNPTNYTGTVPFAAIAAVDAATDYWYGWNGDNGWQQLYGSVPVDGTPVDLTIEFGTDTSNAGKRFVRYSINGTPLTTTNGGAVSNLYHSSETTLPSLTKIALAGYGSFGNFSAAGVKTSTTVTIDTSSDLLDEMLDIPVSTSTPAQIVAALNEVGSNDLPKWQSLALGINPKTTTRPYVAPVQTGGDNAGKLGFQIGNYGTPLVGGSTVKFDVVEYSDAACTTPTTRGVDNTSAGSTAYIDAPAANGGVKYYKIKIKFN